MTIRRILRRQHLSAISLCLFGLVFGAEARAQSIAPAQVSIAPASLQVAEGNTVEVAVEVRDVSELYGADVAFTFDPAVVEVVDADPALGGVQVALGLFLDPGFVLLNEADNEEGKVHFAMTQLNPSEAKSGTGVLIVVKLRGKQAGADTTLEIVNVQLATRDGVSISATTANGQIAVVETGDATGASTPIPSQGAGTPLPTSTRRPTSEAAATPQPTSALPQQTTAAATAAPASTGTQQLTNTPPKVTRAAPSTPSATNTSLPISKAATAPPEAQFQPSVTAISLAMHIETTPTITPVPGDASLLVFVASEGQRGAEPGAVSPRDDRTLFRYGLASLGLAILLAAGVGATLWRKRREDPKGGS